MILANLTKAIREQNYYAVVLEFLIVIAGVVIGFQITAWNEMRESILRTESLTARLIDNLRDEQWRVAATIAYYGQVSDNAEIVIEALEGRQSIDDETLVIRAFRATQIINFTIIRATYDELVATGGINLISDEELINAAIEYYDTELEQLTSLDPNRPYRNAFFKLADGSLYNQMAEKCAEPPSGMFIGDYEILTDVLTFPCDIVGEDQAISELANRLRSRQDIVPLLRQRAIETRIEVRNQYYWRNLLLRVIPVEGEAI